MHQRFKLTITDRAQSIANSLSLRELLLEVTTPALVHLDKSNLEGYGGIFLHGANAKERDSVLEDLRAHSKTPPFVTADIESGPKSLPKGIDASFGSMMAYGVSNDPQLVYELGKITGQIARAEGYNWSLAPCVDLISETDSPMVSIRSAGKDPNKVARITWAFAQGMQEGGLIATAKHFPGDGFCTLDQHLTTPINPLSIDEWETGPGRVFQYLIDQGIKAIMPGHIALPCLDHPDLETGQYPPASLSKTLLSDLLKNKMGFDGLIISDAVNMSGFCGYMNYYDACARFLQSGGDVLLFPKVDNHFHSEMTRCLNEGKLTEPTLRNRAARIISMKEHLGLFNTTPSTPPNIDEVRLKQLAANLADKSVGILRDRKKLLPLQIDGQSKLLHVVIYNEYDRYKELISTFTKELTRYSDHVTEWVDPGCDRLFLAAREKEFDYIICSIGGGIEYGANVIRLHGPIARNMMYGWMKMNTPTVFVAHHHPFVTCEYESAIDCCVATLGSTPYNLKKLTEGILGNASLPHLYI